MPDDDGGEGRELWRRYTAGGGDATEATGCPDDTVLAAFLDGRVADAERARLEAHLEGCARCRAAAEEARAIERSPLAPLPEATLARLARAVLAEQRRTVRVTDWRAVAAALVLTCGTGFWLGARAAADAAAVRGRTLAAPFDLDALPVVSVP
jgi:anti-sigma factor RsiW